MSKKERCGATTKDGDPCEAWAMDNGRCRMHGGTNNGRPVKHGRYSTKKESLQAKISKYQTEDDPDSLWEELAVLRALLQRQLEPGDPDNDSVLGLIKEIRKTLDTINKMMTRTALTQAEIQYLQARYADILRKYVPEDKRHSALRELRSAVGND